MEIHFFVIPIPYWNYKWYNCGNSKYYAVKAGIENGLRSA